MPKEIYNEKSLWRSFFSPGVRLCSNFTVPDTTDWGIDPTPPGRYISSCRRPKLIQRLLEAGFDEKVRRLLFLPPPATNASVQTTPDPAPTATASQTRQQTVASATTQTDHPAKTATGAQTTDVAGTAVGCRTTSQYHQAAHQQTTNCSMAISSQTATNYVPNEAAVDTSVTKVCNRQYEHGGDTCTVVVSTQYADRAWSTDWSPPNQRGIACLEVGLSPTNHRPTAGVTTQQECHEEMWVPWTDEEMGQLAKDNTQSLAEYDHTVVCAAESVGPEVPEEMWKPWTTEEMAQLAQERKLSVLTDDGYCSPEELANPETVVPEKMWLPWTTEEMSQLAEDNTTAQITTPTPVNAVGMATPMATPPVTLQPMWTAFTTRLQSANNYKMPSLEDLPEGVAIIHPDNLLMQADNIGQGAFGRVFRVRDVTSSDTFPLVCKRMMLGTAGVKRAFDIEVTALHHLRHLDVVPRLYGVVEKTPRLPDHHVLMEYLPAAHELYDILQATYNKSYHLSDHLWLDILIQVAKGVKDVHAAGILHNDLKFDNVMVSELPAAAVKVHLIDFGMASIGPQAFGYDTSQPKNTHIAPEVFNGEATSELSDIYAIGLLVEQVNFIIDNDKLRPLHTACQQDEPSDRPFIDAIINYLTEVQRNL